MRSLIAAAACTILAACGSHEDEHGADEHDHDHEGESEGAGYVEGKGMMFPGESLKAMEAAFAAAERRSMASAVSVEAQVYRSAGEPSRPGSEGHGQAYAAAFVSPATAAAIRAGDAADLSGPAGSFSGSVWRIDPASQDALANEEVIIAVPDADESLKVGDFLSGKITLAGSGERAVSVPASAVLETATGKFAFVKNGEFLLRVPVETGAESGGQIEITKGLREGDTVAVHPVQMLYLIELRATKGGGHSH